MPAVRGLIRPTWRLMARTRRLAPSVRAAALPVHDVLLIGAPIARPAAQFAIKAALRAGNTCLNWANGFLYGQENNAAIGLGGQAGGDNADIRMGEVDFFSRRADEEGGGMAGDEVAVDQATGPASGLDGPRAGEPGAASQGPSYGGGGLPGDRYIEREESWLRFNQRVLELAEDELVPLLERVRFLAIFASNLDEFFMVRIAGRMRRMATGLPVEGVTTAGMPADQVLERTLETARELSLRHAEYFNHAIRPALADEGIEILRWKELSEAEQQNLQQLFRDRIYPVLTPLVVDPAHPFPYISGLSLSLAVMIADPDTGATMFARVKVPPLLPRFLTVGKYRFVPIEDVIAAHLPELFTGLDILEHHVFRVTRTRELEVDEDVTEDLMQQLERELLRRRFEPAVRLEVEESISAEVLDRLVTELGIDRRAVYHLPGPLDLTGLNAIADLDLRRLKYPPFVPSDSAFPPDSDVFATLDKHDVLVHHPYDSFTATVERLTVEAAADPRVLAIKQTLYRTSASSSIVEALIDAAEAGKQVVVVVELKARFDERANILWARKLEEAGCHVVYGFVNLKTHCKMTLVVREEPGGSLRRYCHIGTGNYNPSTARLYEDVGAAHLRSGGGQRRHRPVQRAHRVQPEHVLPAAAGGPVRGAARPAGADRAADRAAAGRPASPDPAEVQRDRGRGGD